MGATPLVCSNCGAKLRAPNPGEESLVCHYCGTTVLVPAAPKPKAAWPTAPPRPAPPPQPAPTVRISPLTYAVPGLIMAGVAVSVALNVSRQTGHTTLLPAVGGGGALGEHLQWDGTRAPVVGDVDGDGVEDFIGRVRSTSPDALYLAAYSGKTFKPLWQTQSLGGWSEALDATEFALAGGRVVVTDFHHAVKVLDAKTGKEIAALTTSDKVERTCSNGKQVWLDVKDKTSALVDVAGPNVTKPKQRPDWCPAEGSVWCRNVFRVPHAKCTDSGTLGSVPGFDASRVFWDGDVAVGVGTKSPGTGMPMAVGVDGKTKRVLWRTPFTTSPSVSESAPRVADVFGGRLFAYYEMKSGPHHVVAIATKTGHVDWDKELPQSATGGEPGELMGSQARLYVPHWTWLDVFDAQNGNVVKTVGEW